MEIPQLNKRFLASTRGQIVALLRGGARTVSELAEKLDLTGNAVRAHLATLERDELVQQSGLRPGPRKPHYSYELTPEAEHLFPKSYGTILNELLSVLGEQLSEADREALLREVGRRLAAERNAAASAPIEERIQAAADVFVSLGGLAEVAQEEDHWMIRGGSCPLGAATAEHPQMCKMAETLVEEIVGAPVRECCTHDPSPRCCFEIDSNNPTE